MLLLLLSPLLSLSVSLSQCRHAIAAAVEETGAAAVIVATAVCVAAGECAAAAAARGAASAVLAYAASV